MQINSLSSLVTSAYDTARSNLRSMAEAAAAPEVKPALAEAPQPQPEPRAEAAPRPVPGQRQGVSLDAYA
ncbi:hypothetical protein Aab01nite_13280 [Paractinoplanes abujensis]|uniref:Uncharacterized protein n=1 Tax=Paractinoplanes abujensis TaxID=882441 RepID=A0A7W7FZR6_9ACTN|nr:hypothetical protein [Actinoplanes abujensis]MBB4690849.1 hypothetical protein [Actinoplanes abujensis]GID17738.1 hypothetical protein Aab01nite_13280 [Actinoplanes abujensis]